MMQNDYIPFSSEIMDVIRHTAIEYTYRMSCKSVVRPGPFLRCLFQSMAKRLSLSAVSATATWI